jgi:hypothetical protein
MQIQACWLATPDKYSAHLLHAVKRLLHITTTTNAAMPVHTCSQELVPLFGISKSGDGFELQELMEVRVSREEKENGLGWKGKAKEKLLLC